LIGVKNQRKFKHLGIFLRLAETVKVRQLCKIKHLARFFSHCPQLMVLKTIGESRFAKTQA
jgi:hypothetical protein